MFFVKRIMRRRELFCDDFSFACGDKGGVTVVISYKDNHTKFVLQNGSLSDSLTAGINGDAAGSDGKI